MQTTKTFYQLGLASEIVAALTELGYETPTPVQEQSIPILIESQDLLAQAQTGTGKTAAFALPILSQIDLSINSPQAIVIAPTRELAIQVAEAFQTYAKYLEGFQVTPIYGGQSYPVQLKALKRGAHVIVGTPGRVMDHLRRGTLILDALKTVVLDEADEMLKMGFVEDIEWILEQIPQAHQTALFSATMPARIKKITNNYLKNPQHVQIKPKETTINAIQQFYMRINGNQKLEALTRFLEVEEVNAAIVFTRTKNTTTELAEKLRARGYTASALNGDMNQSAREKVIAQLKNGSADIIIATDVAARGIDVERVSHVINFDIPHDVEAYIHRIGRTGRAGRQGTALLFVTPREKRLLNEIERAIHSEIKKIEPPSIDELGQLRRKQLTEKLSGIITKSKKLKPFQKMVGSIIEETEQSPEDIAAALIYLNQQSNPLPTYEIEAPASEELKHGRRGRRSERKRPAKSNRRGENRPSEKRKPGKKPQGKKTQGKKSQDKKRKHR